MSTNQKVLIAIGVIAVILLGYIYYYGGYKYGSTNPPAGTSSVTPNPQGAYPVSIKNFAFNPAVLNINKGNTVTWTNNDSTLHRISGTGFQSGDLTNGQSYSFTFNTAGTYDYICGIHTYMKGQIIVK